MLSSAVIGASGLTLALTYNEALDDTSEPAAGDGVLSGTSSATDSVNVTGSTVVWTLDTPVFEGETVTFDYTPGVNPIRDVAENDAAALSDQAVTNNSTVPAMIVPDAEGDVQDLSFTGAVGGANVSRIRFPSGYDPEGVTEYSVIFVFHGKGASAATVEASWLVQFDAAVAAGLVADAILVFPDFGDAHWYVDSLDGTSKMRTKLEELRERIELATTASASNARWHLQGMSMGGFGAASWFGDDASLWGSLQVYGGANLDATTGNNWAAGDADDFTAIFGDDQDYLEEWSPAQLWVANAAAITTADRPIRICLGASDTVVDDSMIAFDAAIAPTTIRYANDTVASATHSFASYMTNDTTQGPMWAGAAQYVFHTDADCHGVVNARYTACYTESGGTVTSFINRVDSTSFTSGTLPAFSATGLNGRPCFDFNGTSHAVYGADAAWTAEMSGSDLPFTELWVWDLDVVDAVQTFGGYSSTTTNTHICVGTNTTGNGRTRHQKVDDDGAGAVNSACNADVTTGVHQDTWQTDSAGTTLSSRRDRVALTLVSSAYNADAATVNRVTFGARIRNATPTIDEFTNGRLGARIFYGSSVSAAKLALAETKLRQEFII